MYKEDKEILKKYKNCRYRQLCRSTKKGTWLDCRLGKGLDCHPLLAYCKYEKVREGDNKFGVCRKKPQRKLDFFGIGSNLQELYKKIFSRNSGNDT